MSTFERERQRPRDLLASAETDSEKDESAASKNEYVSECEHDTSSDQEFLIKILELKSNRNAEIIMREMEQNEKKATR